MDRRDDWPDGIPERDPDATAGSDPAAGPSAERIARDRRNMDAVLSAMANRVGRRVPAPLHAKAAPARRRPVPGWGTLAPVAAAAAVAGLILARGGETGEEAATPIPPSEARAPSMVSEMDVEADRPFAVFPTSDPDIAVVWLLNPQEKERTDE